VLSSDTEHESREICPESRAKAATRGVDAEGIACEYTVLESKMMKKRDCVDRRHFLKAIGAAGFGSVVASADSIAGRGESFAAETDQETNYARVPKRELGENGVEVSSIGLGANRLDNENILRTAHRWGITYWDTASYYVKGNSERTIGQYLARNPEARREIFIASKASGAKSVEDLETLLQGSLERLNTGYIDLYHGMHSLGEHAELALTEEVKAWALSAKERNLIRFFGFSTHKNMVENLHKAAKLDWVDVIQTAYNFRLMQDPKLQDAIEACYQAGIGIVAMKAIALTVAEREKLESGEKKGETEEDRNIVRHFLNRGFTEEQAKIKYVLEDARISSVCVGMNNVALLAINAAAALDKTELSQEDRKVLVQYTEATRSSYCAGCASICDAALPDTPCVCELMRYLMYCNSYGERNRARELFARIPGGIRRRLLKADYSLAEAQCPQHMPIGKLISEAVIKLG
jgi:predicted aldo/keto reductase-like oxidoreductase